VKIKFPSETSIMENPFLLISNRVGQSPAEIITIYAKKGSE
jgi:hypothetical protein